MCVCVQGEGRGRGEMGGKYREGGERIERKEEVRGKEKGGGCEMGGKKRRGRGQKARRRVSILFLCRLLGPVFLHATQLQLKRTNDQHREEGFYSQVGSELIRQFCQTGVIANGLRR